MQRRKISTVTKIFTKEIQGLRKFDSENQVRISSADRVTAQQIHFLTEAIFFRAFRAYERFLRDVFLLYCQEKRPKSGKRVTSFLKPQNFQHSEDLIKSSLHFLDWNNPDTVIKRAETYLVKGFPIKNPLISYRVELHNYRRIRNHIAHDSEESLKGYKQVLRGHYGTIPLENPSPGEFLLLIEKGNAEQYKLLVYFDVLEQLAEEMS